MLPNVYIYNYNIYICHCTQNMVLSLKNIWVTTTPQQNAGNVASHDDPMMYLTPKL